MNTEKQIKHSENPSTFVLLKNGCENVFWTTDDGSNHEADGFSVLHRGTTDDEMVAKWREYYYGKKIK